jgi:uncharacterized protein with beta-barrel porin domain
MSIFHRPLSGAYARAWLVALLALLLVCADSLSPVLAQCVTSGNDVTCTNTGNFPGILFANVTGVNGNATVTNSGSVGGSAIAEVVFFGNGNATVTNSGSIAGIAFAEVFLANGNATVTNSGSIAGVAFADVIDGSGNATVTNSGSIAGAAEAKVLVGNGNATVTNFGSIAGGVTVLVTGGVGSATLTNYAGSSIIGPITLTGSPNAFLNFVGGNFLYTLTSLAGVTINTNGAPFAVSGNSVAVLDPTALALQDRSVMFFTAAISSMLQDRFSGMPVLGNAAGGAMGFAPDAADRMSAAHDAFSGIPSLAMAYSTTDTRASKANAMYTKAPAAPVYDTVVWTSGFGGGRQQLPNGSIQRASDVAFGGVLGVDRQVTSDLRLGAFVGGGNSKLQVDHDLQKVDSDYVFGGGYGRLDQHKSYIDFALFGGRISSKSERQISNNTVANGLELATASYGGWFVSPDVTYGYRFFMGDNVLTPKARVRYVGGSLDSFSEVGSAQGLSLGKRNLSDIEERLGVEFASTKPAPIGGGMLKVSVDVSGIGLQRLGDNTINAVLLAQNIAFTTPGKSEAYGGVANVGLDWRPKSNVSLYVSAEGTAMSDNSFSATGKGGVRVGF